MEPDNEAALGLVNHLTTEELRSLMNDDARLNELITDLPQLRLLAQEQEMLLASTKSLAEHNLSMEPKLIEGKQELITAYEEASTLSASVGDLKTAADGCSGKYKPDTIQALLQTAAHETEEETEKLVEIFLAKEVDVDDFLNRFISERTIAHLRRIKAEKLLEMIRSGRLNSAAAAPTTSPGAPNPAGSPYHTPPAYGTPGQNLPYPTNYNMPMPGF